MWKSTEIVQNKNKNKVYHFVKNITHLKFLASWFEISHQWILGEIFHADYMQTFSISIANSVDCLLKIFTIISE